MSEAYRLTEGDAAIIRGMLARGDKQHDIAAYYTVMHGSLNAGRVAEIATGERLPNVEKANPSELPPPLTDIFAQWRALLQLALKIAKEMK